MLDPESGVPRRLHGPTTGGAYRTLAEAIEAAPGRHYLNVVLEPLEEGAILGDDPEDKVRRRKARAARGKRYEWWEASGKGDQLGHTEQKALGRIDLDAAGGYHIELRGEYSACTRSGGCFNTLDSVAKEFGIDITYRASDQPWNAFFAAHEGHIPEWFQGDALRSNNTAGGANRGSTGRGATGSTGTKPKAKSTAARAVEARAAGPVAPQTRAVETRAARPVAPEARSVAGELKAGKGTKPTPPAAIDRLGGVAATEVGPDIRLRRGVGGLARPAAVTGVGLVVDVLVDYVIGSVIAEFQRKIAEIERPHLRRLWNQNIYPRIEPQVKAIIELERGTWKSEGVHFDLRHRRFIRVKWEELYRAQADDWFGDTAAWLVKFLAGDPGFVALLEDVRYLNHELTRVDQAASEPRRYFDQADKWLLHQERVAHILVWDPRVRRLAIKYRDVRTDCAYQLDTLERAIYREFEYIPTHGQERIQEHIVNRAIPRIYDATSTFDFATARQRAKAVTHAINGQFSSLGLYQYRIERMLKEVSNLLAIIAARPYRQFLRLPGSEQLLLSMFLGQKVENL